MTQTEMQRSAALEYINNILSDSWDESQGDEVWCAGFRVALQKIQGILNKNTNGLRLWGTELRAIDPLNTDRGLIVYAGPNILAINKSAAQEWCRVNRGYLKVVDELVAEIPCKPGTYEADFDNMIDYEAPTMN